MPFKITSLGGASSSQPVPLDENAVESWSEFAVNAPARIATQAVPRAVSGVIGIPAGIAAFAGQTAEKALSPLLGNRPEIEAFEKKHKIGTYGEPAIPYPSVENVYSGQTNLLKKLGVPESLLEQKPGFIEGTINRTITALPYISLLPGSFIANAARELSASAGGQAAEELGFGATGQLVGSLLGGLAGTKGVNKAADFFKKGGSIETLERMAQKAESGFYSKQKELGDKISVSAPKYRTQLNNLYNEIVDDTGLKSTSRTELMDKLQKYEQDIVGGKIKPSKLAERTKQINAAYSQVKTPAERTYLQRVQKAMFQEAESIGKSHPDWYNAYEAARSIGRAESYRVQLPTVLEDAPQLLKYLTNATARAALGVSGIGPAANKAVRAAGFLYESPEARKLLLKSIDYTLQRNIPALERTYRKLNELGEKFDQKESKQLKGKFIVTKL